MGYVNNESFGSKVSPRVSGSVVLLSRGDDVFSGRMLRAGYAEGIKEPSFEQSFGIAGNFPVVLPNPDLKPEQTHGIEAGIEQSMSSAIAGHAGGGLLPQLSFSIRSNSCSTTSPSPANM